MEISTDQIQSLIHNPMDMQKLILEELENSENIKISNASNPFIMLLESAVTIGHASAIECKNNIRKKFPDLASNLKELYHHLDDEELNNIFSTPAYTKLKFFIPVLSMKNVGYRPTGASYFEVRIPKETTVTAMGMTFTIINTVIIRIYDTTETPYVEILPNEAEDLSESEITMVESEIMHDTNQQPYITFVLPVKQFTISKYTKTLSSSSRTKFSFPITDKFIKAKLTCKGTATGNVEVDVPLTLTDDFLNPSSAKAFLEVNDGSISVTIPPMYIVNNKIGGNLSIHVYETKGATYLPLDKYSNESFSYTLGNLTHDAEIALSKIQMVVKGAGDLVGGTNPKTFEELKESVVYKTTGPISIPVTNYQISKLGSDNGYQISKVEDIITNRVFTASKELPSFSSSVIQCIPDTYNNTVGIKLEDLRMYYPEWVRGDNFIIKSGTVFKEVNGILKLLSPQELEDINNLPRASKVTHFKENKYFYNFFTYSALSTEGTSECKIYHLDYPSITNIRHIARNQNVLNVSCYISKYAIKRIEGGFEIMLVVEGNNDFNEIDQAKKQVQVSIPLKSGSLVHYVGTYVPEGKYYSFFIKTDEFITTDSELEILNGDSDTPTRLVNLESEMNVYCYILDDKRLDKYYYLREYIRDTDPNISVLTSDKLKFYFGKEITYLWNRIYHTYTERKYKTYKESKKALYPSDVYATDTDGNLLIELDGTLQQAKLKKLHNKGDEVQDENGDPVYEYREGDVILQNGEPVIDAEAGVIRYIDMLMLEYEFSAASANAQAQLEKMLVSYFETILLNELPMLNQKLLERSKILFKAIKSSKPVTLRANNKTYNLDHRVSPTITLYVDRSTDVSLTDLESYKYKIGIVINDELKKATISIPNIVEKIKNNLVISVNAVKITNMLPGDSQIGVIEGENRLTLDKSLVITEYKETIVAYNINLEVEKI